MKKQTKKERMIRLLERKGMLRPRDLDSLGSSREYLNRFSTTAFLIGPVGDSTRSSMRRPVNISEV